MHRAGIGGVLIMEVDQGSPVGRVKFMSAEWRAVVQARTGRGPAARPGGEYE